MTINIRPVDRVPEMTRSGRTSICQELVEATLESPSRTIEVTSDSIDELMKHYKALIQYRNRHPEYRLGMKKDGPRLYLWGDSEGGRA